jgi:cation diffusion facilitator CzcD-associated flavoprotein CzcO
MAGLELVVDGRKPIDLSKTIAYKGMMYSDVPNLASAFGYTNASWTLEVRSNVGVCLSLDQLHGQAWP